MNVDALEKMNGTIPSLEALIQKMPVLNRLKPSDQRLHSPAPTVGPIYYVRMTYLRCRETDGVAPVYAQGLWMSRVEDKPSLGHEMHRLICFPK